MARECGSTKALSSPHVAIAYFNHPVLGRRHLECANAVLNIEGKTVLEIFGYPDDLKLKSSMTLFSEVATDSIFINILNKYFSGERDSKTLELLKLKNTKSS